VKRAIIRSARHARAAAAAAVMQVCKMRHEINARALSAHKFRAKRTIGEMTTPTAPLDTLIAICRTSRDER